MHGYLERGLVVCVCFILTTLSQAYNRDQNDPIALCSDKNVSWSLMQIPDRMRSNESILDAEYCACPGEDSPKRKDWSENTSNVFTWVHHEREDWLVQFRFCYDVIPHQECTIEEREDSVAIFEVPEALDSYSPVWRPSLKDIKCACPKQRYVMKGWRLFDPDEERKNDAIWRYEFACDRGGCSESQACLQRYLSISDSKPMGYTFPCSCWRGTYCPIEQAKDDRMELNGKDDIGDFILGFCQEIPGWKSPTDIES